MSLHLCSKQAVALLQPKSRLTLLGHHLSGSVEVKPEGTVKPFSEMPGPTNIPFLGNFLNVKAPDVGRDIKELCTIVKHLHRTYGKLVRTEVPFRSPNVFVFCPDLAEQVYRFAGSQPMRMGFQSMKHWRSQDELFKGRRGLLVSQKEEWYEFRRKVQQPMLRPKSTLRYHEVIEEVAIDFIKNRVLNIRNENNEVPHYFQKELYKWALESVSCLALNMRIGYLNPDLKEDSEQFRIVEALSTIVKTQAMLDNGILFWKYFPSKLLADYSECSNLFKDMAFKYIHASMEHIKAHPTEDGGDPTILELFYKRGCDERTAVVMALDMIFAGIDSTSYTAAFALYHLAVNPDVQDKLFQEISTFLPRKDSRLDRKTIERMPYLRAVVKETLRRNPPLISNSRKLEKSVILGGYEVPAGAVMSPFHYIMMNSPDYVTDPDSFLPERWLKDHPLYEKLHPFVALPFGHGPRLCIGKRFAELELHVFLMKMVQHFRIEWHHGDMTTMTTIPLTAPSKPLKFTFIDR